MVSEPTAKNFSIRSSIGTHPCADMKFANERSSAAACRPRSRGLRPPARGPDRGLDALRSARRAGRGAALPRLLTRQPVILPASTGELVKLELGEIDFPLPPDQTQSNVAARGSAKLHLRMARRLRHPGAARDL